MGLMSALLALVACDNQRISELEEGVATEADVRARFGEPEKIWDAPGGGRTFEPRLSISPEPDPEGCRFHQRFLMDTIGNSQ